VETGRTEIRIERPLMAEPGNPTSPRTPRFMVRAELP
jgi:hypothetical protein